jgi:uncharacterized membrane-anchored protein YhcB (DUF1043 family)
MRIQIPHDWHVPVKFSKRLGDDVGRQRVMEADGHLLLVLHGPPEAGASKRAGRLFWRDPEGTWRSKPLGDGVQALKRHVAEFGELAEGLEKKSLDADSADSYYTLLRELAPLQRTVRHLHAVLQESRELAPEDRDLINLRDRAGEIERALELVHGDAKNGLDFTAAHQAEKQSQRTYEMAVAAHRLNLLAATFFPLATSSAVFGAIFAMMHAHEDHGLQSVDTPLLFWISMGVALVAGVFLGFAIGRKPVRVEPAASLRNKRPRR